MTYAEAIKFLYESLPMFQNMGAGAYKPGLDSVLKLSEAFGNPHEKFKSIHVAGTNGKGSTSSLIAASLQFAGYKTALYTSPHLVDFRERMRVNGQMISEEEVTDFVERYLSLDLGLYPSFFELTTVMAFEWFAKQDIDVAVIEVGLGGRLDCTNILTPLLSVITNISFDHTALLGDTLSQIAKEKAGIIKPNVPVIISEAEGEVREVFEDCAKINNSPITFVQDELPYVSCAHTASTIDYFSGVFGDVISCELTGQCQPNNAAAAMKALQNLRERGLFDITDESVKRGFSQVCDLTGLAGRWMKISEKPLTVCDTGHNTGGWAYLSKQILEMTESEEKLHIILGFVNDKDVTAILELLPKKAHYYFTQATVNRAMSAEELREKASKASLRGASYETVSDAYEAAKLSAKSDEAIFIGGSTFVVADLLQLIKQ